MSKTKIEWADRVWNPVTGCSGVSEGCRNCYAEVHAKRFWGDRDFHDVLCHEERLEMPFRWRKPQRIFVNSMSDLFHSSVPDLFIHDAFHVMRMATHHTFMILTKRHKRMHDFLRIYRQALPNVWLGVSVENQEMWDYRVPALLAIRNAHHFVSLEPLLGPVDMHTKDSPYIEWVICGGESGPKGRPMHPDWVRALRDQCKESDVPFFFKQWGEWLPGGRDKGGPVYWQDGSIGGTSLKCGAAKVYTWKDDKGRWSPHRASKVGKKKAGNLLDGERWEQFPGKE